VRRAIFLLSIFLTGMVLNSTWGNVCLYLLIQYQTENTSPSPISTAIFVTKLLLNKSVPKRSNDGILPSGSLGLVS
jgi:hypothetical protein